jgi:hypothetical protein
MSVVKAIAWGFAGAVVATVLVLMAGFLFGLNLDIPGFVVISSASSGTPNTELRFSPFATLGLAVLLSTAFWMIGRFRRRRQ